MSIYSKAILLFIVLSPMGCTTSKYIPNQNDSNNGTVMKNTSTHNKIITIRSENLVMTKQGLPNFVGISKESAGAQGIAMNIVEIPPNGIAKAHLHRNHETAIYILEGEIETKFGEDLKQSVINKKGDFVYIPANCPHQPRNLSKSSSARAVISRTDPNEQESVELYHSHKF